jgi:hypothetical protein
LNASAFNDSDPLIALDPRNSRAEFRHAKRWS